METFFGPTGINLANTATFAEIARIFCDLEEITAARGLEKLKQGNKDFSRYYADLVRLVTMTPDTRANSRRRALKKGLFSELLDSLKHQGIPMGEALA